MTSGSPIATDVTHLPPIGEHLRVPHVVAAPDKFRGTATAAEIATSIAGAARVAGWTCDQAPVADGGEGLLVALAGLGGRSRRTRVQGPLGRPVDAEWRMIGTTAVIEMARASGLLLAGGPEGNDPMRATTAGTGELIAAAVVAGARRVVVGLGGSATTDGGLGALAALEPHSRLGGVELLVACDVTTAFVDAAVEFGPQKGATPAQVALLQRRLERLAMDYRDRTGTDVLALPGAGAAGGLAGGLATVGGRLVPGFELVADLLGLAERVSGADLVVTGEGAVDEWSFQGKAVGGVVELAADAGAGVLVVAGEVFGDWPVEAVSLVERFGRERAMQDPAGCVAEVVLGRLRRIGDVGSQQQL
jgi:glycerate 2-kinase